MKVCLVASAIGLAIAGGAAPAAAQSYPWCGYYSVNGGAENCGFSSFEQCLTALGGIGGICMRNTQYISPSGTERPRPGAHRRRR